MDLPDSLSEPIIDHGSKISLSGRKWQFHTYDDAEIANIARKLDIPDILARILNIRGVNLENCAGYLAPTLKALFPDPSSFVDMDIGAEIVFDAIQTNRATAVFADYDVDGATASALLIKYFRAWGQELGLYVPDRLKEGYGPTPMAFERLKVQGFELVITVDCGAAAHEALKAAEELGLEVIVIDHHLMSDIPTAVRALINPNRPDCQSGCGHLAAAGVVFVFLAAMNRLAKIQGLAPKSGLPDIIQWLDLCALGTICDVAPLKGVNRAFVRQGLKILSKLNNPGLTALSDIAGIGIPNSVYHAGFVLGPRLNAGSRVGDSWLAAHLLSASTREQAIPIAERLHQLNDERKAVEQDILDVAKARAEKLIQEQPDIPVLVLGGDGWHPGVIGIIAGRLKDLYHRPAIVVGWGEGFGDIAKGSARSVLGIDIGTAISDAARSGIILSGGGHAMAAGLSLYPSDLAKFTDYLVKRLSNQGKALDAARILELDAPLSTRFVTESFVEQLEKTGPYGAQNPEPVFYLPDMKIISSRIIGDAHLGFRAKDYNGTIDGVAWRIVDQPLGDALLAGGHFDLVGKLKLNEWNNRKRVQFELLDAMRIN